MILRQSPLRTGTLLQQAFATQIAERWASSAIRAQTIVSAMRYREIHCCSMSILRDLRLALRLFWRTRLLTGVALLSIALSVGATAVVFTAIKAVLINPLPYAHPEELVRSGLTSLASSRLTQIGHYGTMLRRSPAALGRLPQ